ncbi:hypothetical protein EV1_008239 [Malus domestica]
MRNSWVLARHLLRSRNNPNPCAALAHPCNSLQTLTLTSVPVSSSSPPPNLYFLQHRSRRFSSFTDYPDWRWNKFWDMHMPWEDRRLFVVPPEISFYEKDEYDLEIKRVQDKSSSAVFCFYDARTDDFCFIHSVINRWAKEFPHVALYEIIIDHLKEDDRINVMREYNINCTPTFRFFQNGEKVDDLAGGSAIFLENTLNKIYGGGEWSTAQVLDTQLVKKDGNGEGVCSSFEVEAVAHDTWDTSYELKHYSKCPCNLCRSWKYLRLKLSQQRETEIEKDEK